MSKEYLKINNRYYDAKNRPPGTLLKLSSVKINDFPAYIYTFFYIFSAYLVIPIYEVPLLGLSISAPLFFLITVPCVFKPPKPWLKNYSQWIFLAISFFIGVFVSTLGNGIINQGTSFSRDAAITLVRYVYWLVVFVITAYFASQALVLKKLTRILGWAVLILALLRWFEGLVYGKIGAGTRPVYFTQNSYGSLFSIFSPYLLILVLEEKGLKRFLAVGGNFLLWGAVLINGSRGSWVAISVGILTSLVLLFISKPQKFAGLFSAMMLVALGLFLVWSFAPQISDPIQQRLDTFQSLDEDKSYEIRKLMVQKGLIIFKHNPLIGVGADRFIRTSVEVDIPRIFGRVNPDEYLEKSAHNSYIVVLAEFGLAGSIPFAFLLLALVIGGVQSSVNFLRSEKIYYFAIFVSLIQMSIHYWVIASITNTVTWFVYGLCAAMIVVYKEKMNK